MATNKTWKITSNRFVAFIDILGFRDLVQRESHSDILSLLYSIRNNNGYIFEKNEFFSDDLHVVTFSDSVILFTKGDSYHDFTQLFTVTCNLFARMILLSVPAKGSVAHGTISVDRANQLFFGQPIIDSYLLGEDLSYLGIVAHNSIDKYVSNLDSMLKQLISTYLFEIDTPFKYGTIKHYNAIWPLYYMLAKDHLDKSIDDKERPEDYFKQSLLDSLSVLKTKCSGSPRRYIDNTMNIIMKMNIDPKSVQIQ